MEETVLCYIENNNDQYLLLYRNKKKKDLNGGKYIGVGGHIEKGESKEEALLREVKEETGLILLEYTLRGKIFFSNEECSEIMYLYTSNKYKGNIIDCNEGELVWIDKNKILDYPHWEGDEDFLKLLQENAPYFEMKLEYNGDILVNKEVNL